MKVAYPDSSPSGVMAGGAAEVGGEGGEALRDGGRAPAARDVGGVGLVGARGHERGRDRV